MTRSLLNRCRVGLNLAVHTMCSNVQQILKLLQKEEPLEADLQFIKKIE